MSPSRPLRTARLAHPAPPTGLTADQVIRWFGARQYDVIARYQLLRAGLTRHQIDGRLRRGVLRPVHRGVVTTSARPLGHEARVVAAILAGPGDAVASHRSAAALHGALPARRGPVHLTAGGPQQPRGGIVVHRSTSHSRATTTMNGIPCTTIPRTLVDVAATEGPEAARRAWTTLAGRRALDPRAVEVELRRHGHRPGAPALRAMLESHRAATLGTTRSGLEAAALAMCANHGLPMPRVNALVETETGVYEADLLWEAPRVVGELDDWSTHGHPDAFREDRERDFALDLAGWRTRRLLREDVTIHAARTARRLDRFFALRLAELGRPPG